MLHGHHPFWTIIKGVQSVSGATTALLLAWVLIDMVSRLEVGVFFSNLIMKYTIPSSLLPVILLLLSAAMALATGFSWGVFGMMLLISVQVAMTL